MPDKPTYEQLEHRIRELERIESRRRRVEEALQKRIVALTDTTDHPDAVVFEELFNIRDLQRLQDEFAQAACVASIITRPDGTPITAPSNFCRLCSEIIRKTEKGRVNCFHSDAVIGRSCVDGPTIQLCLSGGLWDAGAGIRVGGQHVANWLIGQVRDETQSEEKIRDYARQIGVEEEKAVNAFREVPAMSREQFGKVAQALFTLANQISTLAYHNVQQARLIRRINDHTEWLKELNVILKTQQETSLDGIVVSDENNHIISVNQRFVDMWHIPKAALASKSSLAVREFMMKQISNPEISSARLKYLDEHLEIKDQAEIELKDGRTLQRYSSPMVGEDGKYYGRVFYFHDISEHKLAQERYRKLNEELEHRVRERTAQLEDANKELESFSYSVSHDLRAPLRHIDGFSTILIEDFGDQLAPGARSYVERIRESCNLMVHLIDDLLMLSKVGRYNLVRTDVDLSHMALEIATNLQKDEPGRSVVFDIPPGLAVRGDERLLIIMLSNLLGNAWKFSRNRASAEISFNLVTPAECAKMGQTGKEVFCIKDNGVGFNMAYVAKLFGAFQRLHTDEEFEGTGIGLSTVQRIVHRHGGRIWAESEKGKGAVFYFYLE